MHPLTVSFFDSEKCFLHKIGSEFCQKKDGIIYLRNREFLPGGEADWGKFRFDRNVVAQRCRSDIIY